MTNLTFKTSIDDWQGEDRKGGAPAEIDVKIQCLGDKIILTADDDRKFALELQDGVLRLMAYENENGKETPLVVNIPPAGDITVDRQDYDNEPRDEASFDL